MEPERSFITQRIRLLAIAIYRAVLHPDEGKRIAFGLAHIKRWLDRFQSNPQPLFAVVCLVISAALTFRISPVRRYGLLFFGVSIVLVVITSLIVRRARKVREGRVLIGVTIASLVAIMIVFRTVGTAHIALPGLPVSESTPFFLTSSLWIGPSYLILRLIHLLIEYRRLPDYSIEDALTFGLFPSALVAGPVQRMNDFLSQRARLQLWPTELVWVPSLWRIALGVFKKLVLASAFGLMALDTTLANNSAVPWTLRWVAVFAYSFMLYFDFAGYSDIAIGTAGLLGVKLPENFANPYAQRNLTRFWQSWHISFSTWLRDYLFFPISRSLLKRLGKKWAVCILALAHVTTMVLAGLWHGFTSGFVMWGLWHGVGLFAHARWSTFARQRDLHIPSLLAVPLTFVFVSLGWVFFALPDARTGFTFLQGLLPR